jgi:2-oxoisovalerate dehydrogenase E2 component (dihydrolipoyl transacylase)
MSRYAFKLPDLGEGTVSSEIVAWKVKVGDVVAEDQPLVEMSTEKAVIEVPAPVAGRVLSLVGQPGDAVAVGAELAVFETDAAGDVPAAGPATPAAAPIAAPRAVPTPPATAAAAAPVTNLAAARAGRVMASPATRRRAREAGINLAAVAGSGPGGRIARADLDAILDAAPAGTATVAGRVARTGTEEIKVIGVRRVIAQRMSEAKRTIPHFAYVEEVDVTELESLRAHLNARAPAGVASLTYLPFIIAALCRVLESFPQCNAHYDGERNVVIRHHAVHVGIATQTPDGLKVPVLRHAEALGLRELAAEVRRVSEAARSGRASRAELSGSTITVTSLGRLGGIASTPVINAPEVAIVGVNKAVERPVVVAGAVAVRRMMNLSSSFDHRFVDGFDAAAMIQALKERLEYPATIFIDDPHPA